MREGTEPPDAASTDGMPPADEPPKTPVEPAPPLEPVEPVGAVDAGPPPAPPGSISRSIALGVIAFVATIVLLAGFFGLVARSGGRGAEASTTPAPSVGAASSASATPPSAPASVGPGATNATLVGAGDIADCSLDKGAATATIVDGIAGTVFTAGDNA